MSDSGSQRAFAIQEYRGILIAPIQVELTADVQHSLRKALLEAIRRTGARGVIVNVSGLDVIDLHEFESLRRTLTMAEIMGARCVLTGLRPGIVSALIALDADVDGIETTLTIEQALTLLEPAVEQPDADAQVSAADADPDYADTDDGEPPDA